MSRVLALLCSRLPQAAALTLISFAFAGCSGDMSTRVSQDPFVGRDPYANPFGSRSEATGSVPVPQPERRELPQYSRPQPYQSSSLPPAVATPQSYPVASPGVSGGGVSGGGRGLASYAPPSQPRLETTGTVPVPPRSVAAAAPPSAPAPAPAPAPAQGGIATIVGPSDTLEILAQRYHTTPAAVLAANGHTGPRTP